MLLHTVGTMMKTRVFVSLPPRGETGVKVQVCGLGMAQALAIMESRERARE